AACEFQPRCERGRDFIVCEVQIRTRLQDAWAELSHDDVYKQPGLAEDLCARAKDLAEVLAAANRIAGDIRQRVMREVVPPAQRPNLARPSAEGLAFIFEEVFGRSPHDYAIRLALNEWAALGIDSLEPLRSVLGRSEFREALADAYRHI